MGEAVDILVRHVPQRRQHGRAAGVHVADGGAVGFELAGLGEGAAAAAHEQGDGAPVELLDGPGQYVLPAATVAEVEQDIAALEARLHLRLGGRSLDDEFPTAGKLPQWLLETGLAGRQVASGVQD